MWAVEAVTQEGSSKSLSSSLNPLDVCALTETCNACIMVISD